MMRCFDPQSAHCQPAVRGCICRELQGAHGCELRVACVSCPNSLMATSPSWRTCSRRSSKQWRVERHVHATGCTHTVPRYHCWLLGVTRVDAGSQALAIASAVVDGSRGVRRAAQRRVCSGDGPGRPCDRRRFPTAAAVSPHVKTSVVATVQSCLFDIECNMLTQPLPLPPPARLAAGDGDGAEGDSGVSAAAMSVECSSMSVLYTRHTNRHTRRDAGTTPSQAHRPVTAATRRQHT
jgi:hypothetical protein